jgi:predicted DNA-binding transcriptional regulator AlpA
MRNLEPLLRDTEVATLFHCSKATVWRRVADGILPPPIKICGISRWLQSELAIVIESAQAARDA